MRVHMRSAIIAAIGRRVRVCARACLPWVHTDDDDDYDEVDTTNKRSSME